MLEENKQLVRRYYQQAMGDLSGIEQIVAADYVDHHFPPGLPAGPEGVRQFFKNILSGIFSDMRIDIDLLLAEGDRVDCHLTLHARHTGEFAGIAPQGTAIRCPAISTFRIAGGKLAEGWEIFDSGDLLRQMRG
jgi:predicted ester cyclase